MLSLASMSPWDRIERARPLTLLGHGALCCTVSATLLLAGCKEPCEGYLDDTSDASVAIHISNQGTAPVYVTSDAVCGAFLPFEVRPAGESSPLALSVWECSACSAFQDGTAPCTSDCPAQPVVRIEPGGDYETAWDGRQGIQDFMPESCYADESEARATCDRLAMVDDGSYELVAHGHSGCSLLADGSECTCQSSGAGYCEVVGEAVVEGYEQEVTGAFDYPPDRLSPVTVELVLF